MYLSGTPTTTGVSGTKLFDDGRAKLWAEYVALLNQLDPAISARTVTGAQLAGAIATVLSLIARHKALYAQAQQAGAATSWLDPRFQDFEKPFEQKLSELQAMAAAGGVTQPTTGAPVVQQATDLSTPTQLIIQGGAPAAIMPTSANVSSGASPGGGVFADLFGPPAPTPTAQAPGLIAQIEPLLPWIAAGLGVAYFLRRK